MDSKQNTLVSFAGASISERVITDTSCQCLQCRTYRIMAKLHRAIIDSGLAHNNAIVDIYCDLEDLAASVPKTI